MPDAEPLDARRMSAPPVATASAETWSLHRLLRGLEALVDPLAIVLSLWFVDNLVQGAVTPQSLVVAVLAFALA